MVRKFFPSAWTPRVIGPVLALVLASAITIGIDSADARPGGGSSVGSRGNRTFGTPPSTATTPNGAAPIQRSITQPGSTANQAGVARPGAAQPARSGGFGRMLMGGLLGAGLFGLLMGGGFGGLMGMVGLLFQIALIGGLIWLAMAFFRNRGAMAPSGAGAGAQPSLRDKMGGYATQARSAMGGNSNGLAGNIGAASTAALELKPADFDRFEVLLETIQDAYGREDVKKLEKLATPEMLSYFVQDLHANAQKGVHNEVSGAKLLQGDLSEAWSEPSGEYATVAMRYSLIDAMVDKASGRITAGDRTTPQEVREMWTFRRDRSAGVNGWELSAIQQA